MSDLSKQRFIDASCMVRKKSEKLNVVLFIFFTSISWFLIIASPKIVKYIWDKF